MTFDRNEYDRNYQGERRAKGREQTDPPPVQSKKARKQCDASLYHFGLTCFPETFFLEPSPDHKRLADQIQTAIDEGTKRAIAVQRGFGKTSWCVMAVKWAALTGRVGMAMLISGNQGEADGLRDGIVTALETQDPLYDLYPEIPHFFRETAMHGPQLKATYKGEQLRLKRRSDIVFPAVPFIGAENCIRVAGIDGKGIRGAHHVRTDGTRIRPTLILLDDPQDDDLARSGTEVEKRVRKIKKTIHGLGPPGKSLSVLMPCTPIEKGDLAETFLDISKTPEYQGIRWPALDSFPDCFEATENNLWAAYFDLLSEDLASGLDRHPNATKHYQDNQETMGRGAVIRWPARIEGHCIDALQSLMNRYAESRSAFMSEFQMEPDDVDSDSIYLNDDEISTRYNKLRRGQIPSGAKTATTAIDIQKRLLYWMTMVWSGDGTGHIVDYGTFPKQPRQDFTHLDAPNTMEAYCKHRLNSSLTWEESLKFCLRELARQLREPVGDLRPQLALVDARWNETRMPVEEIANEKEFAGFVQAGGGQYVEGGAIPISKRKIAQGSHRASTDVEWYVKKVPKPETIIWDANHYRSKFQTGLATEPGTPGSITFFGKIANRILAEHFGAKQMRLKEGTRRTFEEWKNKPNRYNDHWLDCAVMNRVALEVSGYRQEDGLVRKKRKPKKKLTPEAIAEARKRIQGR